MDMILICYIITICLAILSFTISYSLEIRNCQDDFDIALFGYMIIACCIPIMNIGIFFIGIYFSMKTVSLYNKINDKINRLIRGK